MLKTPADKWALYDQLIALADPSLSVSSFAAGRFWLMVVSSTGAVGLAQRPGSSVPPPNPIGLNLREAASWVKSWDFDQAAVGLAAINAAINAASLAGPSQDAFDFFQERARGHKVAVVGHFPYLARLKATTELVILERDPKPGDLPDSAAEYVLPAQDFVFATGTTIINKTLPRLLELTPKAVFALVGPSTPLSPVLFDYGVSALAGLLADNSPELATAIQSDQCESVFRSGARKINLLKLGLNR
ncbi:MAG: DUF364 domain-containing protein [Deltaproteobacteria bacterium]|jgi:uncharacterized protein (DUF4213/DUF364 family)|nr:DUF364 domain-containing protein [Deltaproteobacteria bacterium]